MKTTQLPVFRKMYDLSNRFQFCEKYYSFA